MTIRMSDWVNRTLTKANPTTARIKLRATLLRRGVKGALRTPAAAKVRAPMTMMAKKLAVNSVKEPNAPL